LIFEIISITNVLYFFKKSDASFTMLLPWAPISAPAFPGLPKFDNAALVSFILVTAWFYVYVAPD
jgi:hypothetical protein